MYPHLFPKAATQSPTNWGHEGVRKQNLFSHSPGSWSLKSRGQEGLPPSKGLCPSFSEPPAISGDPSLSSVLLATFPMCFWVQTPSFCKSSGPLLKTHSHQERHHRPWSARAKTVFKWGSRRPGIKDTESLHTGPRRGVRGLNETMHMTGLENDSQMLRQVYKTLYIYNTSMCIEKHIIGNIYHI